MRVRTTNAVATVAPMKRGLKAGLHEMLRCGVLGSNRCPDEKGTERLSKVPRILSRVQVATVAPMKRGLKGHPHPAAADFNYK